MLFVNRFRELEFLNQGWESHRAELQILYGRRRVGKTELLKKFVSDKRQVQYVATQSSLEQQLRGFAIAVRQGLGIEAQGVSFEDWQSAFQFIFSRSASQKLVAVLDEFPYLVEADPSLPSVLQACWDQFLRDSQVLLLLSGSSISFMESEVLGHASPLFGRRTGQYLLNPMTPTEAGLFHPELTPDEQVQTFAVLGGMPAYLQQFDSNLDFWTNVDRKILQKGAFLHEEVPFLLMQELREPRLYLAILTAIAEGHTRLNEIGQRALGPTQLNRASFYLQTLQNLRLVERRVPVTELAEHKSRKGIYRICDPFVRFWMRFVHQESSALEMGDRQEVLERIKASWSDFVAPVFEEICRESLTSPAFASRLPFRPWRVGSWWGSKGEIDLVAIDASKTKLLVGECKWSTNPIGPEALQQLQRNSHQLAQELANPDLEIHYALFSRSGFSDALRQQAGDALLLTPEDLF